MYNVPQASQIYVNAGDMVGVHTGDNGNDRVWLMYEAKSANQTEGIKLQDLHDVQTSPQRDVFNNETGWSQDHAIQTRGNTRRCVSLRVYHACGKPIVLIM